MARISGLEVDFERRGSVVHALRGVDLEIRAGEILGVVGESGSGKTVLGLSLLGLVPDSARVRGSVVVDGVDMVTADAPTRRAVRRRALGAVFQDPMTSLNPTMRVGRQVAEVAGSAAEATRLLEAVGIADAATRLRAYPHELSGGLRQRVMLAIALAGEPRLVIADEPTTALDVTVQEQVLRLFAQIRDELGCAILLVTHDLGVASTIADRIAVMYAGRLVELGAAVPLLAAPAHPYTASLLSSRITLRADRGSQLPMIVGEPPDPRDEEIGCSFAPRCPAAADLCYGARPELLPTTLGSLAACHFQAGPSVLRASETPVWGGIAGPRGGCQAFGVTVTFGGRTGLRRQPPFVALDGVDLEVAPGEAVALVGESGSGKTTLLRVLAGLQPVSSGSVELAGAKRPQMVFQDAGASLTPWLRVDELLGERLRHLRPAERKQRILEVLAHLGLSEEIARVRPGELSGGQRQRVALARAVVDPPDLLLCDEPISALDASLAATVLNLLGRLRRELGFATVFVTHDLVAARLVADRIAVMTRGRIVETGATEDVVLRPQDEYTRTLLGAVPEVAA
ncbi:MAG: oligopeptide/dipeptide ABC transporter ATP-binding protein [Gaiellaceae bacterium]